jgi:hypothetical protein
MDGSDQSNVICSSSKHSHLPSMLSVNCGGPYAKGSGYEVGFGVDIEQEGSSTSRQKDHVDGTGITIPVSQEYEFLISVADVHE